MVLEAVRSFLQGDAGIRDAVDATQRHKKELERDNADAAVVGHLFALMRKRAAGAQEDAQLVEGLRARVQALARDHGVEDGAESDLKSVYSLVSKVPRLAQMISLMKSLTLLQKRLREAEEDEDEDGMELDAVQSALDALDAAYARYEESCAAATQKSSSSSSSSNRWVKPELKGRAPSPPTSSETPTAVVTSPRGKPSKVGDYMKKTMGKLKLSKKQRIVVAAPEEDDDSSEERPVSMNRSSRFDTLEPISELDAKAHRRMVDSLLDGEELLHVYAGISVMDCVGSLWVTNARMGWKGGQPWDFEMALQNVASVSKTGAKRSGKNDVTLVCKDLFSVTLSFLGADARRSEVTEVLLEACFPRDARCLFAYRRADPWPVFDHRKEFARQFKACVAGGSAWRLTEANATHALCHTYPSVLCVPRGASDELLREVAEFRSASRIPALSYLHRNGVPLARASQPLVGIKGNRSVADETLLDAFRAASPESTESLKLLIVDARPKANALANQAMGKGFESEKFYPFSRLKFMGIANIHVMRDARKAMVEVRHCKDVQVGKTLANSHWLEHVWRIIHSSVTVAHAIHVNKRPVLLHCSDGWDRTPQLSSLCALLLDAHFRTKAGFAALVQKEWASFGHKFAQRLGHHFKEGASIDDAADNERSPVFLQFLDCCYQLTRIAPCAFEWNARFLESVADACISCHYGDFLFDSEWERIHVGNAPIETSSMWPVVLAAEGCDNVFFDPKDKSVLIPRVRLPDLSLWPYHLRHSSYKATSINYLEPKTLEERFAEVLATK